MQRVLTLVAARVERTVRRYRMTAPGDRVLVAVSGGPDSVGLLAVLAHLRRSLAIEVTVAHVNHGVRGAAADADEACAATAARRLGVAFLRRALSPSLADGGNFEARARTARYGALQDMAREASAQRIATGHTRDDQAETVLLRLLRGTGPAGLAGIRPCRGDGVIRPLIDCDRDEVAALVRAAGLDTREDASNRDSRYRRVAVRHEVLPLLRRLNPSVNRALARVADLARAEAPIVADWVERRLDAVCETGSLPLTIFDEIPGELRGHVLRAWLAREGVDARRLTARHVKAALRLARRGAGAAEIRVSAARLLRRRGELFILGPPVQPLEVWRPMPLKPGGVVAVPGGWRIAAAEPRLRAAVPLPADLWGAVCDGSGPALEVRAARRAERVRPFGLGGTRRLSDVFTDRKIPAEERWYYPVVAQGNSILWIPGVLRTELRCLSADTRSVIALRAERTRRNDVETC